MGDLTPDEIEAIQSATNAAGRPIYVVGSAARGARRGVGTNLPIGKGPGTRSDIDYLIPDSSYWYWKPYLHLLPGRDTSHPVFGGVPNEYLGPSVRFEPE